MHYISALATAAFEV